MLIDSLRIKLQLSLKITWISQYIHWKYKMNARKHVDLMIVM